MKMFNPFSKDDFRVVFRAVYTLLVSIWTGLYLWKVTFTSSSEVSKLAEFIIGFVLGTLIATLINFYFGGSENATKQRRSSDPGLTNDNDASSNGLSSPGEDPSGDVT